MTRAREKHFAGKLAQGYYEALKSAERLRSQTAVGRKRVQDFLTR